MGGKQLGVLIRNIRKAHGQTQLQLARAINVEDTTISMYENGHRQPDIQILQAIAMYYGITVDQLLSRNYSTTKLFQGSFTWGKMIHIFEKSFPWIKDLESGEDRAFEEGCSIIERICQEISLGHSIQRSIFERALSEFTASMENFENPAAAINTLWLIFVMYSLMPDEHSEKLGNALFYNKKLTAKQFVSDYALRSVDSIKLTEEISKREYAKGVEESVLGILRYIKGGPHYADFADFYMALRYLIGMVDNDMSLEMNRTIGIEMMLSLVSMDNQLAFNFIKAALEL